MTDALQKHLAEIARLHPIKWDIYLSMSGIAAWRMYRRDHAPVALLLDMFASTNQYDAFTANLYTTVQRYTHTAHYRDRGHLLVAAYEAAKTQFDDPMYVIEDYTAPLFLGAFKLRSEYGIDPDDARVQVANRLATSMINTMYRSYQGEAFIVAMAALWFQVCDATLILPAQ